MITKSQENLRNNSMKIRHQLSGMKLKSRIDRLQERLKENPYIEGFALLIYATFILTPIFGGVLAWTVLLSNPTTSQLDLLTNLLLTAVTAAMVIAIYLQVSKESDYLENFEPNIELVKTSKIDQGNSINLQVLAQNTSQTSTIITDATIEDSSNVECSVIDTDRTEDEGRSNTAKNYIHEDGGKIPIAANQSVHLGVALRSEEKIRDNLNITCKYMGSGDKMKKTTLNVKRSETE